MQVRQISVFSYNRKRQILALSFVAISAGGCANGPVQPNRTHSVVSPHAAVSGVSGVATGDPNMPVSDDSSHLKAVVYDDVQLVSDSGQGGMVFAAPVVVAQNEPIENAAEESFSKLLENDGEKGSEGAGSEELASPTSPDSNSVPASRQPVEYFVRQALAAHPNIQAARQRVQAELERIPQVTALPDPQFNNTFWPLHDNALQTAGGRIANQMSLQQGVPFPDKLRAKGAIVGREAQMAQAEVERIERQITESVRLAYYEVWYATRAIEIIEETRNLVDDLTKVAEARYRSGGTQQDVLRAQLETDRLDDQLVQLRRQKQVSQADLAALLQQPETLIPEAVEDLGLSDAPMQLDGLIAQAEQCNPNLPGLAAEIQRDREKQRLACLQQYPDFMVGLNWGIVSDSHDVLSSVADGHDNLSVTFGTTLPVWREKINAGVREANRRTNSTQQRLEAERDEIYGRLRRLLVQADALVEQTDIYENRLVPRTEDTLKLAIADYRGERTDFFTLIETYRELLMFETQLARINATLAGTIAQIDRTVGCAY